MELTGSPCSILVGFTISHRPPNPILRKVQRRLPAGDILFPRRREDLPRVVGDLLGDGGQGLVLTAALVFHRAADHAAGVDDKVWQDHGALGLEGGFRFG